jgi:hypothetical protein
MLKALRSLFASTPENGFITYLNNSSSPYCSPSMGGSVGDRLEFSFILDKSWKQLYNRDKSESHKIAGVSDLLGNNSLRLGVRRKPKLVVDGLVAVMYLHINGKTTYPAINKFGTSNALILAYDKEYNCKIYKRGINWVIEIYEGYILIGASTVELSISSLFRRLSGIYIEPAIYSITTYLKIIRR